MALYLSLITIDIVNSGELIAKASIPGMRVFTEEGKINKINLAGF
jgi:hypothetical protein